MAPPALLPPARAGLSSDPLSVRYIHSRTVLHRLLLAMAALVALAVSLAPRVAAADPARQVYVGVYLRDVTRFDQRNGTFDVDMEAWVKWLGDFDPGMLRIANESDLHRDNLGTDNDAGWHVRRWRLRGTLRGEFPLHRFPFDRQTLAIAFELPERDGRLIPDVTGSGMESHFSITGWHYAPHFRPRAERMEYPSDLGSLQHEGLDTIVHRVRFEVTLERPVLTGALKLFLPLFLILMVALLALLLPVELIDPRSGIGVTALLACFAFQFTVAGTIPDVAYVTIADAMFLVGYAVTALALLTSVAVFWLHRHARDVAARRIDVFARVALPLGAALVVFVLVRGPPAPSRPGAPRLVEPPRSPSTRSVVRVGVSELRSLMTSVITQGTRRGLLYVAPDDTRVAFLAERLPAVGNEGLEVLADGRFRVHWSLREGSRWSDGHALTSDDLRFALEVSPDPHVVAVQTPDPRTVLITYDGVLASAMDGVPPLPRHRLADAMRRGGFEAVSEARRTQLLPGAGPYRVVRFTPDREALLEANPYFLGAPPSIRRVELRCIVDHAALVRAFERGELDLLAPNALTAEEADAFGTRVAGVVLQRPSNQLYALQADPAVAFLESLPVRNALLAAIDRDALALGLFGVAGQVAHAPLVGPAPAGIVRVAFDPTAARAALASAGVAGRTLRLTHGASTTDRRAARVLTEAWTAAGMVVVPNEVPAVTSLVRGRSHGGLALHAQMVDRESDSRRFWSLPRVSGRSALRARTVAFDDVVADLAEREERALFPERREQLQQRLRVLFSSRLPLLPLVFGSERYVVVPALRGWDLGPGARFGEAIERWHFVSGR